MGSAETWELFNWDLERERAWRLENSAQSFGSVMKRMVVPSEEMDKVEGERRGWCTSPARMSHPSCLSVSFVWTRPCGFPTPTSHMPAVYIHARSQ